MILRSELYTPTVLTYNRQSDNACTAWVSFPGGSAKGNKKLSEKAHD
jgi:hypothetical protein